MCLLLSCFRFWPRVEHKVAKKALPPDPELGKQPSKVVGELTLTFDDVPLPIGSLRAEWPAPHSSHAMVVSELVFPVDEQIPLLTSALPFFVVQPLRVSPTPPQQRAADG